MSSSSKWNEIIRTRQNNFCTPNLYKIKDNKTVSISLRNFKLQQGEVELFLFLKWRDQIYYPIWLEFRSINNNLLYLTEDLKIKSFNLVRKILQSSLSKEEKRVHEMKALVYHVKEEPKFSHLIKDFQIEPDHSIDIWE